MNAKLWVAVVGAVSAITVGLIRYQPWKNPDGPVDERSVIAGRVVEQKSNLPVPGAEISIAGRTEVFVSEDTGNFRFVVGNLQPQHATRLLVAKPGYRPIDRSVTPPVENLVLVLVKQ